MVKRIRKRIPKASEAPTPEEAEAEAAAEEAAASGGLRAELAHLSDDEFTARTAQGLQWLLDNGKLVGAVVGAALVAMIAVYVMQRQKTAAAEEAAAAFNEASETYLTAYGWTSVPGETKTLTPEEKKAQIEKAQRRFADTETAFAERPVSILAAMGKAGAAFDLGKVDEALAGYDKILARTDLDPFARVIALQGRAAALESNEKLGDAIEAWRKVESLDAKAYGLMANLNVGRLLVASGKKGEAKALYEKLKKEHAEELGKFANRQAKTDIEKRLAALGDAT